MKKTRGKVVPYLTTGGQYEHLEEHIQQKKWVYEKYKEGLKDLPVFLNPITEGTEPNYWLSALIIDEEAMCKQVRGENEALYIPEEGKTCPTEILEALNSINAEGRPIWKPMHRHDVRPGLSGYAQVHGRNTVSWEDKFAMDRGFQVLCFMIFPLAGGMMLVADQAVILLYGEAFMPAILTIRLMCPLILIKGFGDLFCYQLVYSTKSEKIILPASASASIINVVTNAVLIPVMLHNGAVVASVFSELVTNIIQFIYMKKKVQFKLNGKALTRGIFSTAIMCAIDVVSLKLTSYSQGF